MDDSTKKMLGNLSPAYGIATGHGAMGKLAGSGAMGLAPAMIARNRRKKADGSDVTPEEEEAAGMKKGGKVKKYAKGGYVKAADGCAQRGKTRGKVI
jgi:hypothetical protein